MIKATFLALMIAAGPVQAELAHFCSVMEATVETCCCGHEGQVTDQRSDDCDPAPARAPCCETVVRLTVSDAHGLAIPASDRNGDPAHDPPIAIDAPAHAARSASRARARHARPRANPSSPGTCTYLRTLRLRL